jgi:transposase-like protein
MTERARYWQELVHEQQRSGLSRAAFCRQRRINPGTFAWWRRKLRDEAVAPTVSKRPPEPFLTVGLSWRAC